MHEAIADGLRKGDGLEVRTAWLDQPDAGLTDEILAKTDVLTWWGHMAHGDVPDAAVERVYKRVVIDGMGLVVLHSGHFSKIFKKLMGTSCDLKWREEENEKEVLWVTRPGHPIVAGIDDHFVLDREEMYGEFSTSPSRSRPSLSAVSAAARCSAAAAAGRAGRARFFTSAPGMKRFQPITTPPCRR